MTLLLKKNIQRVLLSIFLNTFLAAGTESGGSNDVELTPMHNGTNAPRDQSEDNPTQLLITELNKWGSANPNTIKECIDNGADVNAQSATGNTALMWAAYKGHLDMAQLLLNKKADVNAQNNNGYTALMYAASYNHLDMAQLLLNKKADVNAQNNNGYTALMWAVYKGNLEIVKLLLEKTPNVNAQSATENTALIYAASHNHLDMVKLLLQNNADVNKQNNNGYTALMWAAYNGNLEIVQLLLNKNADVNAQSITKYTALKYATFANHSKIVQLLTLITELNKWGSADLGTIQECIRNGADVNARDKNKNTALMWAAYNGNLKIVKRLLKKDANINQQNKYGNTALMYAASYNHSNIVELLLEKGADVNAKDNNEHTALMWAATKGYFNIVKLLLRNGADVNAIGKQGHTALSIAIYEARNTADGLKTYPSSHTNFTNIVHLLLNNGANMNDASPSIARIESTSLLTEPQKTILNMIKNKQKLLQGLAHTVIPQSESYFGIGAAAMASFNPFSWNTITESSKSSNEPTENGSENGIELQEKSPGQEIDTPYLDAMIDYFNRKTSEQFQIQINLFPDIKNKIIEGGKDIKLHPLDLVYPIYHGKTLLMLAAKYGRRDVIEWLINQLPKDLLEKALSFESATTSTRGKKYTVLDYAERYDREHPGSRLKEDIDRLIEEKLPDFTFPGESAAAHVDGGNGGGNGGADLNDNISSMNPLSPSSTARGASSASERPHADDR